MNVLLSGSLTDSLTVAASSSTDFFISKSWIVIFYGIVYIVCEEQSQYYIFNMIFTVDN